MEDNDFRKWVEASHAMFGFYEHRTDMYPISRRWLQDWPVVIVTDADRSKMAALQELDLSIIGIDQETWLKILGVLEPLASGAVSKFQNRGIAITPYLITWRVQRYAELIRQGAPLDEYFRGLGQVMTEAKSYKFPCVVASGHILDSTVSEEEIKTLFQEVTTGLAALADSASEDAVETAMLLHIMTPSFFPVINRSIAQCVLGLNPKSTLNVDHYVEFMVRLKKMLQPRRDTARELEEYYGESILKLVDEGLYLMCSAKLSYRVGELGI